MPPPQYWTVPREWEGETVFIIAGGPSVTQEMVDRLKGQRVIAIKLSCEKASWADILFFADGKWFKPHKDAIKNFAGRVVTVMESREPGNMLLLRKRPTGKDQFALQTDPQCVAVRRTSLTGAMNLAFHLSGGPQVLLGADGKLGPNKETHHHTPHEMPKKPIKTLFDEQSKDLEIMAIDLKARGVAVYNTNFDSAFRMFPFADLESFLQ